VIERLNAVFSEEDLADPETGQYLTYNKASGVLITGNEDAAGHVLWAMQELGFTVPPNANAYWVGEAGPGASYVEAGGERHLYTNKTLVYTVHNLTYFARLLRDNPIPTNLKELGERAEAVSDPEEEEEERPEAGPDGRTAPSGLLWHNQSGGTSP